MIKFLVEFGLIGGVLIGASVLWVSFLTMIIWGMVAHAVNVTYFLSFTTALGWVGILGILLYGIPMGTVAGMLIAAKILNAKS